MTTSSKITCPRCGRTSFHPVDVMEGYCGNCRKFTSPRLDVRRRGELELVDAGAGFSIAGIKAALSKRAQGKRPR